MSDRSWTLPRAHRGYLIKRTILGEIWIEKAGTFISYAQSVEDAMRLIDEQLSAPDQCPACGRDLRRCGDCGRAVSEHPTPEGCRRAVRVVRDSVAVLNGKAFCSIPCGEAQGLARRER